MLVLKVHKLVLSNQFADSIVVSFMLKFFYIIFLLMVTEGKRYSLPNSRIMIHQPLGGAQGGQTDIDIQVSLVL